LTVEDQRIARTVDIRYIRIWFHVPFKEKRMDTFLASSLPWTIKAAVLLACGLVVAVSLLAISKSTLARIGRLPRLSPNWISFWRLPLFWIGVTMHLNVSQFWGFLIVVAACILDVIDGKMAVAFREYGIPRSEQSVRIGAWLDPLMDKLTILPLIALFAAKGIVSPWLAGALIVPDVVGTLIRDPFGRKFFRFAMRFRRQNKATFAGKIKAIFQCFGLVVCMLREFDWINGSSLIHVIFGFAAAFGILSVLSRIHFSASIDRAVDWVGILFNHKDA
jgi:phosphatidylglycerophosphate synthase